MNRVLGIYVAVGFGPGITASGGCAGLAMEMADTSGVNGLAQLEMRRANRVTTK
jgi:hypothetical protein